ncbi:hypothetical protein GCM10009665_12220 [Kitasatospora nipponensis]|uniref:Uncharacterized protein n=1 Tax=Kitasatospora nipponensis TaxID=258049 RepID=A0ABN1VX30_9ACTN
MDRTAVGRAHGPQYRPPGRDTAPGCPGARRDTAWSPVPSGAGARRGRATPPPGATPASV